MDMRKVGPPPLEPKVVKKLLDLLSTDNEFRRLFKQDAQAALVMAGYEPPMTSTDMTSAVMVVPGMCLQMKANDRIAPKAKIIRERAKLEKSLNSVVNFFCPQELQADP